MSQVPPKIILASGSPARKELLKKLGYKFEVIVTGFPEDMTKIKNSKELAKHLALGKALHIAENHSNAIIVTADTFVVLGNQFIGKPNSKNEAYKLIRSMSGKKVEIYTGMAVIRTSKNSVNNHPKILKKSLTCTLSKIKLHTLTEEQITFLSSQPEATKIAGGFSIEKFEKFAVKKLIGDYDNVIGLPIFKLKKILPKMLAD